MLGFMWRISREMQTPTSPIRWLEDVFTNQAARFNDHYGDEFHDLQFQESEYCFWKCRLQTGSGTSISDNIGVDEQTPIRMLMQVERAFLVRGAALIRVIH